MELVQSLQDRGWSLVHWKYPKRSPLPYTCDAEKVFYTRGSFNRWCLMSLASFPELLKLGLDALPHLELV
eukprot:11596550-Alexandrium_andersonii.AAC.1